METFTIPQHAEAVRCLQEVGAKPALAQQLLTGLFMHYLAESGGDASRAFGHAVNTMENRSMEMVVYSSFCSER